VPDEGTVEQDATAGMSVGDRILHSDPHDFAGLYIRHRASFTLHARRYLRDARDADEVVQEAFLRLFLALPELETELQALAYCRRTITNLCIDRFRAQARRPSLVDLDSAGAMDLADDDPGDPVVRAEDAAMVRAALSLLSPLHRAALVKREIEEKTLPVIAEELEIPEESVKHVLFRARRALRRILASTSLAPGSDAEIAGALGKVMRSSSGGVAAFIVLLFLGLGTGPDLRAIPVVGSDLPDLIPVTEIAAAVGDAVVVVADEVASVVTGADPGPSGPAESDPEVEGDPVPAPAPSSSSSPGASPRPTRVPGASPTLTPTPTSSASPTPSGVPSSDPTRPAPATPTASSEPSPEPGESEEPTPTASATPSARPSASSSTKASEAPPRKGAKKAQPAPSAPEESYVAGGGDEPELAEWEESDVTYVEAYTPDGTPVL
jgi:RNA polymerase sigma factor (sigma-70 family)